MQSCKLMIQLHSEKPFKERRLSVRKTLVCRRLLYGTLPDLCDSLRVVLPSFETTIVIFVPSEDMATGRDHDRLRVTMLTGEANWASWKVQMRHQLRSRKLWDIVKGEERIATGAE